MPPDETDIDVHHELGLPISSVSQLLGVPIPTLRSWELRYGIGDGERESGRHRRYYPDQLVALRLMRDEIARGQRAGAAAKNVRLQLGISGPHRQFVNEFLAASERSEPAAMRAALDRARDALGLDQSLDDVLLPAMRQIGAWWSSGRCDQDDEHLATESARAWLSTTASFAPAPTQPAPIVFACGPGDLHTLGLEALAVVMRYRRWSCRVMGARIPAAALLTATEGTDAAAVVVVSHLATSRARAVDSIQRIDRAGIPVFYAGNSFESARRRAGVPGRYLGNNLQTAGTVMDHDLQLLVGTPGARIPLKR